MSLNLGNLSSFAFFTSGDYLVDGAQDIVYDGNVGVGGNISGTPPDIQNGSLYVPGDLQYIDADTSLNTLISDLNNLYAGATPISGQDVGNNSLPYNPGVYNFVDNNPFISPYASVQFLTTMVLDGPGEYVFFFANLPFNNTTSPTEFMSLTGGATCDNIYFYSGGFNLAFFGNLINLTNLYGNFINTNNFIISGANYNINGRVLTYPREYSGLRTNGTTFSNLDVSCYLEGTKILTTKGYINIENLSGDEILITKGIINKPNFILENGESEINWIGKITYNYTNNKSYPVYVKKNSLNNSEDIWVSQGHQIIYDNKFLVIADLLDENIFIDKSYSKLTYYHIECDKHYIIDVSGILSETFYDYGAKKEFEIIYQKN